MDTTRREEWLAGLQHNDRVATQHRTVGYRLYTVDRRTPSGRIIMANGTQFDKHGCEIGGGKWDTEHLEEVTPEILANIEHKRLVSSVSFLTSKIDNINILGKLSNEVLMELEAVLKKYVGEA